MKTTIRFTWFAMFMAAFLPLAMTSPVAANQATEEVTPITFDKPTIRVLLEHKSKGALLEVAGRYAMIDPKTEKRLASGVFGRRLAVRPSDKGLVWGDNLEGVYQFKLATRGSERYFWIDGVQYKGVLYVYQIGQTISLVNELTIEDYVAAIVEANTDDTIAAQAANALAICARSDAWYNVKRKPDAYWNVMAQDVGFRGVGGLTADSRGEKAAFATKGLYLTNPIFGETAGLFLSRWTRHSAGTTVSYNCLNPERPESGEFSVSLPAAKLDRERTLWQSILTEQQIEKAFDLDAGSLMSVTVVRDPKTQKVCALTLKTNSDTKQMSYFRVVQALGSDKIQSSDFTITQMPTRQYQVVGYGEGDGVGLCLYSADQMAQKGLMAPEILQQFFPGSKVELLKNEP